MKNICIILILFLSGNSFYISLVVADEIAVRERVIAFCQQTALPYMKYDKTIEFLDLAKQEESGTWFVSGGRTAKASDGNVEQQYNCRIKIHNNKLTLKLLNLFKEDTKSGEDVYIAHK